MNAFVFVSLCNECPLKPEQTFLFTDLFIKKNTYIDTFSDINRRKMTSG